MSLSNVIRNENNSSESKIDNRIRREGFNVKGSFDKIKSLDVDI